MTLRVVYRKAAKAGLDAEIYFWEESGLRADTVHGKTWELRGQTPVVNANGAFWYCTYEGAPSGELFVELLQRMMRCRRRPVHLVIDGLPRAHSL